MVTPTPDEASTASTRAAVPNVAMRRRPRTCHSAMLPFASPTASRRPSGLNATALVPLLEPSTPSARSRGSSDCSVAVRASSVVFARSASTPSSPAVSRSRRTRRPATARRAGATRPSARSPAPGCAAGARARRGQPDDQRGGDGDQTDPACAPPRAPARDDELSLRGRRRLAVPALRREPVLGVGEVAGPVAGRTDRAPHPSIRVCEPSAAHAARSTPDRSPSPRSAARTARRSRRCRAS